VLTRDILFGMNILTLAGFGVMGLTLTLNRMGQAGKALSIGLHDPGTALVLGYMREVGRGRACSPQRDRGFTSPSRSRSSRLRWCVVVASGR
jgi:hypothetical protein